MTDAARFRQGSGALQILVATAIGGGAGYILTILAGASLGSIRYATFAVFWSALYLVISAISGVQQEIARATRPRAGARPAGEQLLVRNFAIVAALIVCAVTVASAPLWIRAVFPAYGYWLVGPLALGLASYVVVAVIAGVLYGLQIWRFIALLIALDGILRLVLTGVLLLVTKNLAVIAWGVTLPFALTPLILWFFMRRQVAGQFVLDVSGYRALTWNIARTVVGAAAIGTLISGFPLLLGATSGGDPRTQVAALIFSINLTRAPIVIVVLALQSFLIVYFRSRREHYWRYLGVILAVILGGTIVVSLVVALVGPWILTTFFGKSFELSSVVLGVLVGSAGAVAFLCATGPAVLALGRHALYTSGWVVAALVSLSILLTGLPVTERTLLALWIGPLSGLVVHLVALTIGRPHPSSSAVAEPIG